MFLTNQNINIFNKSDDFYTDICYHFESPNGKDVVLNDRLLMFYPNITLCEKGCEVKGINITTLESLCECKLNGLINNDLLRDNAVISSLTSEISEFFEKSNLEYYNVIKMFLILNIFLNL